MNIQGAVKACLAKEGRLARPVTWSGTGSAVDLARRLDPVQAVKVRSLRSPGNLLGSPWEIDPEEFLTDWEVVTSEDLRLEASREG